MSKTETREELEQEYEASLRRAFVDNRCDYVFVDSKHERYLIACASFGQDKGWLSFEELGSDEQQYTQWRYRLTEAGRKHFGLGK